MCRVHKVGRAGLGRNFARMQRFVAPLRAGFRHTAARRV